MSKHSDSFDLALDREAAWGACQRGVANLGWKVKRSDAEAIVVKIGFGVGRNPTTIEISRSADAGPPATIYLSGKINGFGPLQKRQLVDEMVKLRSNIEIAARTGL